jgi:radical SAM superfamily enzyme YgiQ (UPF0313 family)
MSKYVLISDTTLSREYRNFPLLDYLPCAPSDIVPNRIYNYLKGKAPTSINGRASVAPYSIRKLEAALLQEFDYQDVVVAHEDHIESFIGPETEVIGVTTMDPLGLAPLTMSYSAFFGRNFYPYIRKEFESLIARINRARKDTKAKLVIGGSGVWEFTVLPEELDKFDIDFAFQGEADDIACILFKEISEESFSNNLFFNGFQTFDHNFHKKWIVFDKFLSRQKYSKQFPSLEDIPEIRFPTIKGLVEVMRGCGIGCNFCEVTSRPIRYYPLRKICKEIAVNTHAGSNHAWIHSDEIFSYECGRNFSPNFEVIEELFAEIMKMEGISYANPSHGRISIPAAYPEFILRLSSILNASPSKWIGIQMGIETGSDRLAKTHISKKILPLKIGSDGSWSDIVWEGTRNLNLGFWRPAYTVQISQIGETIEDNWDTVALINRLSASEVNGRPFEFTITPLQNVSLGLLRNREFLPRMLDDSQLAVYYASYRHLAKITTSNAIKVSKGRFFQRLGMTGILYSGAWAMFRLVERVCKQRGIDIEKIKRHCSAG